MTSLLKKTFCLMLCLVGLSVRGEVIADFTEDFKLKAKDGWSYQWNPEGVEIGHSQGYVALEKSKKNQWIVDTSNPPTNVKKEGHVYVPNAKALKIKKGMMVPGDFASLSTDDLDHYAITGYTIQPGESGDIRIVNSRLEHPDYAAAVRISIYVNDREIASDVGDVTTASAFNISLGDLKVGDTVYVAIGPSVKQWAASKIQYQLEKID